MKDNHLFDDERRPQNGHLDNDSDTAADTSLPRWMALPIG